MVVRWRAFRFAGALSLGLAIWVTPATAFADPPATTPTNVTVSPDPPIGTLTLSASSTAALVQFEVDDQPPLTPVPVAGDGTATATWDSWGFANGVHGVIAADCSDATTCGTPSDPVSFDLAN